MSTTPSSKLRWTMVALATVATLGSGYLAWAAFAGGQVAGCDGELISCDHVLSSRWSRWLGLPVGLPAMVLYIVAFAALLYTRPEAPPRLARLAWRALLALAVAVAGAAVWFVGLQLLEVGNICIYCVTVHACGLALAVLIVRLAPLRPGRWRDAATGLLGVGGLIIGQILIEPTTSKLEVVRHENPQGGRETAGTTDIEIVTSPQPRTLRYLEGKITIDPTKVPIIGSPDAPVIVTKLFDYTCQHCRKTHFMLQQARNRFGDQLAIAVLPVPLDRQCNRFVRRANPNPQACELARVGLAVWNTKPEMFPTIHDWLFSHSEPPTAEQARKRAGEVVGAAALERSLQSDSVRLQLHRCIETYGRAGLGAIPQLLFGAGYRLSGVPDSERELFAYFEDKLNLRPRTP